MRAGLALLVVLGAARAGAPRRLPLLPTLWAPIDLARFLHHNKLEEAATKVMESVRIGAFDEIDGPAFMEARGDEMAERLGLELSKVAELQAALRSGEESAFTARQSRTMALKLKRPTAQGWGWKTAAGRVVKGPEGLENRERLADQMAGALWGIFIGDVSAALPFRSLNRDG